MLGMWTFIKYMASCVCVIRAEVLRLYAVYLLHKLCDVYEVRRNSIQSVLRPTVVGTAPLNNI
jgi:hypothetical protein